MLRIEYFDKNRFMKQVAASRGSVILHLDNGSTCDLKKDNEASAIFQTLDAPKKGFSISVSDPADVTGFLRYSSRLAAPAENAIIHSSLFIITAKRDSPALAHLRAGLSRFVAFLFYRMHRLMACATASSSSCPMKPNFISCSSA